MQRPVAMGAAALSDAAAGPESTARWSAVCTGEAIMHRRSPLRELLHDHQQALALARRAREGALSTDEAVPPRALAESIEAFTRELDTHFSHEEATIFVALEIVGESAIVQRARAEHGAIRDIVARATPNAARTALLALAESIERHVHFEERVMFAAAIDKVGADALHEASARTASSAKPLQAPAAAPSDRTPSNS